jgi:hypothetical protein
MFSMAKKITIATGLLVLCSGQYGAFGSDRNNDGSTPMDSESQPVHRQATSKELDSSQLTPASHEVSPFDTLPKDIRGIILKDAAAYYIANGKNFYDLEAVRRVLSRKPGTELCEFVNQGLQPWQPCWRAYLGVTPENEQLYRTFFNGVLECRRDPTDKDPAYTLPLIPLMNLSVTDLALPADIPASKYLVVTDQMKRFFEVGGSKTHILFATKAMIAMGMKSMKMSPELKEKLENVMSKWDDAVAPVGFFWRWSDDENLTWIDYLITQDLSSISCCNLLANWHKAAARTTRHHGARGRGLSQVRAYTCSFLNHN